MKLSDSVKSISYLKTHASEIIRNLSEEHQTLIITQNGEAKAIVQDITIYEQTMESLALLKMLALSSKSKKCGHFKPVDQAFLDLKQRVKESE